MRFVVTVMVRDEIDVIAAVIEHTLAQEPDLVVVTDNGSVDGTTEVLQRYADLGLVELHHDPVHRKQQHSVVTAMARRARTEHAADWVLNIDADEFWVPVDKRLTLRAALERTPLSLNAFTVPVTNLVGRPAVRGSGFSRLVWRDLRSDEQLQEIGINAQPTPDAVHRGEPDVVVAQGNHFVSIESNGQPDPDVALEVLHVPWRSWQQFEQKVLHAGRAYEASPDLRPSKNHHGMKDYRRALAGRLMPAYMLRQPSPAELLEGAREGWFREDRWLHDHLAGLQAGAHAPDLLAPLLADQDDEPFDASFVEAQAALGRQFMELERERDAERDRADENRALARRLSRQRDEARAQLRLATGQAPIGVEAKALARRAARGVRRRLHR
ncbi:glycosyltransferase family 2 protein [Angustibacter aerolatus]